MVSSVSARHVVGDVDLVVGVEALPLQHALIGDIEHRVVVALHGALREGRQQDVVRLDQRGSCVSAVNRPCATRPQPPQRRRACSSRSAPRRSARRPDRSPTRPPSACPSCRARRWARARARQLHHVLHRRVGPHRQHVADHEACAAGWGWDAGGCRWPYWLLAGSICGRQSKSMHARAVCSCQPCDALG